MDNKTLWHFGIGVSTHKKIINVDSDHINRVTERKDEYSKRSEYSILQNIYDIYISLSYLDVLKFTYVSLKYHIERKGI